MIGVHSSDSISLDGRLHNIPTFNIETHNYQDLVQYCMGYIAHWYVEVIQLCSQRVWLQPR